MSEAEHGPPSGSRRPLLERPTFWQHAVLGTGIIACGTTITTAALHGNLVVPALLGVPLVLIGLAGHRIQSLSMKAGGADLHMSLSADIRQAAASVASLPDSPAKDAAVSAVGEIAKKAGGDVDPLDVWLLAHPQGPALRIITDGIGGMFFELSPLPYGVEVSGRLSRPDGRIEVKRFVPPLRFSPDQSWNDGWQVGWATSDLPEGRHEFSATINIGSSTYLAQATFDLADGKPSDEAKTIMKVR